MRLLILSLFLIPLFAWSQTAIISGKVTNKSKKPIAAVNVFIDGSYDGATTDANGLFRFTTSEQGNKTLILSAIGYSNYAQPINIKDSLFLQISLAVSENNIDEVVIHAGQFNVGNRSNSILSPLDIVTTAGSMGNIIAALEKLPGAQIAGENGRLLVRGGTPSETQTYINGIRVAQPYTASTNGVPVRGRFSPFLFKGTNFSTGAYSAEFGNALSSILNLNTSLDIEPAKSEISISTVGLGFSNTQNWNETSLSMNASYTNLAPYAKIIQQDLEWTKSYEQLSGEAILRNKGKNHFFNLYGSYALEKLGFNDYDIQFLDTVHTNVKNNNIYLNSNLIQYHANNWKSEIGGSFGYATKKVNFHEYYLPTRDWHMHFKNKWTKPVNRKLQIAFGAEYFFDQLKESFTSPEAQFDNYGYKQQLAAAFVETNFRFLDKFSLNAGLRYTDDLAKNRFVEPRVALHYAINDKHETSIAYGLFHQNSPEEILKYNQKLEWQSAQHYIINYTYHVRGRNLRVEAYQKDYKNLIRFQTPTAQYTSQFESNGKGYARGLDIFWKDDKSIRNMQYWVSYALTDSKRQENNYPFEVQPSYIAKHYLSVVAKYWIANWRSQVGLTNTWTSGRPYQNPNLAGFMQSKTKQQNDLSFNWSYLLSQQKILHFSVTNLLGQTPIYGYKFAPTPNQAGQYASQAITPTAKRFVFVGFFWTISKNKKDNQLDNL